jgi:hypothetical protein
MRQRSIVEVISRIRAELPKDERYDDTRMHLTEISDSAVYRAPEQLRERWVALSMLLTADLPRPGIRSPEWAQKIGRIIRAEE